MGKDLGPKLRRPGQHLFLDPSGTIIYRFTSDLLELSKA
jgi:hypothetical protein